MYSCQHRNDVENMQLCWLQTRTGTKGAPCIHLRLHRLPIDNKINTKGKDYIPCKSFYEFMAVPSAIIKPQYSPYQCDFFTGLISSPACHFSTVHLNKPERALTILPGHDNGHLLTKKPTVRGCDRLQHNWVRTYGTSNCTSSTHILPTIKRTLSHIFDFEPVSYVMEIKMTWKKQIGCVLRTKRQIMSMLFLSRI